MNSRMMTVVGWFACFVAACSSTPAGPTVATPNSPITAPTEPTLRLELGGSHSGDSVRTRPLPETVIGGPGFSQVKLVADPDQFLALVYERTTGAPQIGVFNAHTMALRTSVPVGRLAVSDFDVLGQRLVSAEGRSLRVLNLESGETRVGTLPNDANLGTSFAGEDHVVVNVRGGAVVVDLETLSARELPEDKCSRAWGFPGGIVCRGGSGLTTFSPTLQEITSARICSVFPGEDPGTILCLDSYEYAGNVLEVPGLKQSKSGVPLKKLLVPGGRPEHPSGLVYGRLNLGHSRDFQIDPFSRRDAEFEAEFESLWRWNNGAVTVGPETTVHGDLHFEDESTIVADARLVGLPTVRWDIVSGAALGTVPDEPFLMPDWAPDALRSKVPSDIVVSADGTAVSGLIDGTFQIAHEDGVIAKLPTKYGQPRLSPGGALATAMDGRGRSTLFDGRRGEPLVLGPDGDVQGASEKLNEFLRSAGVDPRSELFPVEDDVFATVDGEFRSVGGPPTLVLWRWDGSSATPIGGVAVESPYGHIGSVALSPDRERLAVRVGAKMLVFRTEQLIPLEDW